MYVDPTTRQTFNYATPIDCGNNPQNIIELDPDLDGGDFYVLTPDTQKREAPQIFRPTQINTTITPNTFTAPDAGVYPNAQPILEQSIIRKKLVTWKIIRLKFQYST